MVLNEHGNDNSVRRRRTWYERRIRNRRILIGVGVLAGIALLAWYVLVVVPGPPGPVVDYKPPGRTTNPRGATPEELGKMAEQGDAEAQWRLGTLYRNGDGIRQSDSDAVEWFRRAAEQRFVPAISALGSQYWAGRGVPQDYAKAYVWYDVALAEGDANAESQLQDLSAELTPEEVANAHQQAKAWVQAHNCVTGHP